MRLRRWVILVLAAPAYTFLVMSVLTVLLALLAINERPTSIAEMLLIYEVVFLWEWWTWVGGTAAVFVASQSVFLLPVIKRRPPTAERGKSLLLSMVLAGFIGAGLAVGLLASIVTFLDTVLQIDANEFAAMIWASFLLLLLAGWVFWSGVLYMYVRGIWAERILGRVVALTFAGTVVELVCILPLDIMVRRKSDCYCFSGTFINLAFGVTALLWLAGPGIVIAMVWRRRRAWREQFCESCGYEKGPSPGDRCPECGYAWMAAATARRSEA